ncbi:MAG: nicotinamide-nucleotide amidohydrolase family protein [Muribaculaceae bacterium]|nr:nicotinamide-nucleotide amidohydrolase family protein [Muribaculaceae bacterium]
MNKNSRRLATVVIGDEILLGQVTDTNSGAIARAFGPEGWTVTTVRTVGDDPAAIRAAIIAALDEADMVVTTGGLGPTKDDITRDVLMSIFGGMLRHDPEVEANIRRVFSLRGLDLNRLTAAQAMVPDSCTVIPNRFGTAPIMWWDRGDKSLVSMPGVPFETEGMLPEVVDKARERFMPGAAVRHHSLIVSGITESTLAELLEPFEEALNPDTHLAYLPNAGYIRLRLDSTAGEETFDANVNDLRVRVSDFLLYDGDATPARILIDRLLERGLTAATAESCTGGNIAHRITSESGASEVFLGGVVSYANEVKSGLLGVDLSDIERFGAVSQTVVEQMAAGACRATGARCSMATSGVAGPGGGTPDKPVGTVWMAWCVDGKVTSRLFRLPGNRARVIDRATTEAILGLIRLITN